MEVRMNQLAVLFLLLLTVSCKTPKEKRRAAYEKLCPSLDAIVCSDLVRAANPLDRATIVAGSIGENEPLYEELLWEVGKAKGDPSTRLQKLNELVSKELGRPWSCPSFEAVWRNEDGCPLTQKR